MTGERLAAVRVFGAAATGCLAAVQATFLLHTLRQANDVAPRACRTAIHLGDP